MTKRGEEANSIIVDFCKYCEKLSDLIAYDKAHNVYVWWERWDKKSLKNKYDEKLFGFYINEKKREEKLQRKIKEEDNNLIMEEEGNASDYEWQIWLWKVDLDVNLQWLLCSKTFWFGWLLKWIHINPVCPHWEKELTKSCIRPNIEKKAYLIRKKKERIEQEKPKCDIHVEEWTLYWKNWITFICNKCIINKFHANHEIIESKEWGKVLLDRIEISNQKSVLKRRNELINEEEFNINISEKIYSEALESNYQFLENIGKVFKMKIESINKIKERVLCSPLKEYREIDNWFKKFRKNQNPNLFQQVSKALHRIKDLDVLNENSQKEYRKELAKNDTLAESWIKIFTFNYPLSRLNKEFSHFSKEENIECKISIQKYDNERSAYIFIELFEEEISLWYCKLVLEENQFWSLKEQKLKEIYSNKCVVRTGELILNLNPEIINKDFEVTFYLYLQKVDESIVNHKRTTKDYILSDLIEKTKEGYNILDNNSLSNINEGFGEKIEIDFEENRNAINKRDDKNKEKHEESKI